MNAIATPVVMKNPSKLFTFQMKCDPEWIERVRSVAKSLGMSTAAYIRQATTLKMDADGVPKPKPRKS